MPKARTKQSTPSIGGSETVDEHVIATGANTDPEAEGVAGQQRIMAAEAENNQLVNKAGADYAERTFADPMQRGFPATLENGDQVTIVDKQPDPQGGMILVDQDGNKYTNSLHGADILEPYEEPAKTKD